MKPVNGISVEHESYVVDTVERLGLGVGDLIGVLVGLGLRVGLGHGHAPESTRRLAITVEKIQPDVAAWPLSVWLSDPTSNTQPAKVVDPVLPKR
jgi:hypothetical protein